MRLGRSGKDEFVEEERSDGYFCFCLRFFGGIRRGGRKGLGRWKEGRT